MRVCLLGLTRLEEMAWHLWAVTNNESEYLVDVI
jgi:hypothetical protein